MFIPNDENIQRKRDIEDMEYLCCIGSEISRFKNESIAFVVVFQGKSQEFKWYPKWRDLELIVKQAYDVEMRNTGSVSPYNKLFAELLSIVKNRVDMEERVPVDLYDVGDSSR